jgi:hypothetical protein
MLRVEAEPDATAGLNSTTMCKRDNETSHTCFGSINIHVKPESAPVQAPPPPMPPPKQPVTTSPPRPSRKVIVAPKKTVVAVRPRVPHFEAHVRRKSAFDNLPTGRGYSPDGSDNPRELSEAAARGAGLSMASVVGGVVAASWIRGLKGKDSIGQVLTDLSRELEESKKIKVTEVIREDCEQGGGVPGGRQLPESTCHPRTKVFSLNFPLA